jgi:hypothetical protein
MVTSPKGLGPKKDYAGELPAAYTKDRPVFSSARTPTKTAVIVKD